MAIKGIGIDITDIKRFKVFNTDKNSRFLFNNFSQRELAYCLAFKDVAPHLAGIFAAKEAVFKALNKADVLFSFIEIRRGIGGRPVVWLRQRCQKSISLTISHTATIAVAVAIKQ